MVYQVHNIIFFSLDSYFNSFKSDVLVTQIAKYFFVRLSSNYLILFPYIVFFSTKATIFMFSSLFEPIISTRKLHILEL